MVRATIAPAARLLPALALVGCALDLTPDPTLGPDPAASAVAESAQPTPPGPGASGRIAFMRTDFERFPGEVVLLDLADGTERVVTDAGYPVAMTIDGSRLLVAEPAGEPRQRLVSYPTDGGPPTELLDAIYVAYANPATSPDWRYVALAADGAAPNGIVVIDLVDGSARQLTSDGGSGQPYWSPDSRWVAYEAISPGTGSIDVRVVSVDEGEPRQLTDNLLTDVPLGWTADGSSLVVRRETLAGSLEPTPFVAIDLATGEITPLDGPPDPPLAHSPGGTYVLSDLGGVTVGSESEGGEIQLPYSTEAELAWAPNDEWVIWTGRAWDDATELFLVRLPDGEPIQLTTTGEDELMPVWAGATIDPDR